EEVDVFPAEPASDSVSPEATARQPGGTAPSQQARDHQAETGRILENLRKRRHSEEEPRARLRAVTDDPETHPLGAHTPPQELAVGGGAAAPSAGGDRGA